MSEAIIKFSSIIITFGIAVLIIDYFQNKNKKVNQ